MPSPGTGRATDAASTSNGDGRRPRNSFGGLERSLQEARDRLAALEHRQEQRQHELQDLIGRLVLIELQEPERATATRDWFGTQLARLQASGASADLELLADFVSTLHTKGERDGRK